MVVRSGICLAVIAAACLCSSVQAVTPSADEIAECHKFVSARLRGVEQRVSLKGGMRILLAENANIGMQRNLRDGATLKIGGKEYSKGLFTHANTRIQITLPAPGKTFSAVVGIDGNQLRGTGQGSAVFIVKTGTKESYRSQVMHEGMPGEHVNVDLAGATDFIIEANDAGDGISYDHGDWADAKVTLQDGKELYVGDLPFLGEWGEKISTDAPFSFTYDGKSSSEFLKTWIVKRETAKIDADRTKLTSTWTDPKTGLELRCSGIEYSDYPTVEWTLYFKNTGSTDTPILENIQALDMDFEEGPEGKLFLNHNIGGMSGPQDFQPIVTPMDRDTDQKFTTWDGFATANHLPYFNIERPGGGMIIALGWPTKWSAEFVRKGISGMRVLAGQEYTHLKLHPGEEIRTPLVALQFWTGSDRLRSQNIWRRWMIAHNMPRPGGKLPGTILAGFYPVLEQTNEKDCKLFIDRYIENGLKPDVWWLDAGWYPNNGGDWQQLLGTWEADKKRFPNGLRGVSDYAHSKGIEKFMVWFEPERVQPGSWLYENHPEWLLGPVGGTRLLDHGNPEAHKWAVEHFTKLMKDANIDIYRQDYASFAENKWKEADQDDRRGISENRYVVGYLSYLDELVDRHPGLMIDICAAGGKRLDLENLRRAVPMWRSDYIQESVGVQGHTYGLASWVPYFGSSVGTPDAYTFRSYMCPSSVGMRDMHDPIAADVSRNNKELALLRRLVAQWRKVAPNYYGDYYPLTAYSLERSMWIAWQFDRPEAGEGFVQAFRRDQSFYVSARFPLMGLKADADYEVTNLDTNKVTRATGKELMEKGLPISLPNKPDSALFSYRVKK